MFAKAKKHAERVGFTPVRINFDLHVHSITLPSACLVSDQSILSVCFERGAKFAATGNFIYTKPSSLVVKESEIRVDERLEIAAVLYQDVKSGKFQQKGSKLLLRELGKQGVMGKFSYSCLGRCNLNLNEIADEMTYQRSYTKDGTILFEILNGVSLKFSITATVQKNDAGPTTKLLRSEDSLSTVSSVSESNEVSVSDTVIGHPDSSFYVPLSEPVFSAADQGTTLDQTQDAWSRASTWPTAGCGEVIPEEDERKSASTPAALSPAAYSACSDKTAVTATSGPPSGATLIEPPLTPTLSEAADVPVAGVTVMPVMPTVPAVPQESATQRCTAEMEQLYQQELRVRAQKALTLKRAVAEQHQQFQDALLMGREDLAATSAALYRERIGREVIEAATHKCDKQLLVALSEARQEAVCAAVRANTTLLELQEASRELQACKDSAQQLIQSTERERALAQRAACVAASANVTRAEVEEENRTLLSVLIGLKVRGISMERVTSVTSATYVYITLPQIQMDIANTSAALDSARKDTAHLERDLVQKHRSQL
jgi:hypothetical protein